MSSPPGSMENSPRERRFQTLVDEFERSLIVAALADSGGNQRIAAEALGMLPTTLNEKMKRLALRRPLASQASLESPMRAEEEAGREDDFRWQGRLRPGQGIELWALDGLISVEPARGSHARVHATRRRNSSAPFSIEIEAFEHSLGVSFRVRYAMPPEERRADALVQAGQARVDFHVLVPSGVRFAARALRGEIEIRGLDGGVDAQMVRGGVRFLSPAARERLVDEGPGAALDADSRP